MRTNTILCHIPAHTICKKLQNCLLHLQSYLHFTPIKLYITWNYVSNRVEIIFSTDNTAWLAASALRSKFGLQSIKSITLLVFLKIQFDWNYL